MASSDFTCPACGEDVHPNAKSCPHCGTRPEGSWARGREIIDGSSELDLPDDDFDYDEFVAREFDREGRIRTRSPLQKIWLATALFLLAVILILIIRGLW